VILDEAEALLDPVSDIEGFMLACLVDASTGMVLAERKDQDDISLPTAAAGGQPGGQGRHHDHPGHRQRLAHLDPTSTATWPAVGRSR
jgi:hypothetical protein